MYTSPDQKYYNAKYLLPYIIGLFFMLCLMQIGAQFVKLDQLNKDTARLSGFNTVILSYSKSHQPNYALAITLDNGHKYNVTDTAAKIKLAGQLNVGDSITIYYPSTLYKVLSASAADDVSQVERRNEVLYSFDDEKQKARLLIGMFAVVGCVFWVLRNNMLEVNKPRGFGRY